VPAFRKIFVPMDFSAHAEAAFRQAHSLAKATGATITIVHVARPPAIVVDGDRLLADPVGGKPKDLWVELHKIKAEDPAVRVEYEVIVADGPNSALVLGLVEAMECDLIVMGANGLAGLKHRLFGGLTEEVVRYAHCPVMVVKAPVREANSQAPVAHAKTTRPDLHTKAAVAVAARPQEQLR
jgi:nucleotide-binding universal stress UspA family protein